MTPIEQLTVVRPLDTGVLTSENAVPAIGAAAGLLIAVNARETLAKVIGVGLFGLSVFYGLELRRSAA